MRTPTLKQAAKLMVLANGCIVLAPGRGDWGPLLRRGWVEAIDEDDKDKRYLPPLRITPDGLRALAQGMERHPELLPDIKPADRPPQLDEAPSVTRLKARLAETTEQFEANNRELSLLKMRVRRIRNVFEEMNGAFD